jgi:hypothetical protein
MSARRVVAIAAIIGDAHGRRQRINDTCTHGQRFGYAASVGFSVPAVNPAGGAAWTAPEQVVQLVASVMGQSSNPVNFTVTS